MDSYGKPWFRIHTFAIGIMFGFIMVDYNRKKQLKLSWLVSIVTWLIIIGLICVTLWLPFLYTIHNNMRDPHSYVNNKTEGLLTILFTCGLVNNE